jgi:hypothetical protein
MRSNLPPDVGAGRGSNHTTGDNSVTEMIAKPPLPEHR